MPAASSNVPKSTLQKNQTAKKRFVFWTLPNYSLIALSSAVEALRMANRVANQTIYEWVLASTNGEPVAASNGLAMAPTVSVADIGTANIVFVCGGVDIESACNNDVIAKLRKLSQRQVALGSLCTGGYVLAKAGLLDKYKAVVHWENMSALEEQFPKVIFSRQLFAIDRDRYTCTGGIAPLDLMLNIIKSDLGRASPPMISDQFVLDSIRNDQDRQHVPLMARVGLFHDNLIEAAALMEAADVAGIYDLQNPHVMSAAEQLEYFESVARMGEHARVYKGSGFGHLLAHHLRQNRFSPQVGTPGVHGGCLAAACVKS